MAERPTARGQSGDEPSRGRGEREATNGTAAATSRAEADSETPETFDDFGRALQEQIAEALEPAIAEFRQQVEEAVRIQGDQPEESDQRRERETGSAPQSSQEEEQAVAQAPTRETERRADAPRRREDDGRSERTRDDDGQRERRQGQQGRQGQEGRQLARAGRPAMARRTEGRGGAASRSLAPTQVFEGRSAARVGWLRLARKWRDAGAQYQAIHAYTEILVRYPGGGVANAAAEELLELAEQMEDQGRFYSALNIMERLERLL